MAKDKLISVAPSTPMSEAAHLMLHHDVSSYSLPLDTCNIVSNRVVASTLS